MFALLRQQPVERALFLRQCAALAQELPSSPFLINLCDNRYLFTLALLAAALRGQTTLLPPSKTPAALAGLIEQFPDVVAIADTPQELDCPLALLARPPRPALSAMASGSFDELRLKAFTSGTTGVPQPWPKNWPMLAGCARLALHALGLAERRYAIIGTTPPQHMYGLETSVIWPLCSQLTLTEHRPFYPEDIRIALEHCPLPVILVSTPVHLQACLAASQTWTNLAGIISSTAPLAPELALALETNTGRPTWELYGSTETQSFAWRRPARETLWRPYAGVELKRADVGLVLRAPWLPEPLPLTDRFEVTGDGRFRALGRSSDLIKIGGKRASLTELNWRLTQIEGVDDGCFFTTDHQRLGALVTGPRSKTEILTELRQVIDEVFLPRPLHKVTKIPRNPAGKLVQSDLRLLLKELNNP